MTLLQQQRLVEQPLKLAHQMAILPSVVFVIGSIDLVEIAIDHPCTRPGPAQLI
jgi:hypothetical protein